jgi:hypothetical protein
LIAASSSGRALVHLEIAGRPRTYPDIIGHDKPGMTYGGGASLAASVRPMGIGAKPLTVRSEIMTTSETRQDPSSKRSSQPDPGVILGGGYIFHFHDAKVYYVDPAPAERNVATPVDAGFRQAPDRTAGCANGSRAVGQMAI